MNERIDERQFVREQRERSLNDLAADLLGQDRDIEARFLLAGIMLPIYEWLEAEAERESHPADVLFAIMNVMTGTIAGIMEDNHRPGSSWNDTVERLTSYFRKMLLMKTGDSNVN